MALHSIAIAKASLAAGLIRPDPITIPRDEIAHFHSLLEAVLKQCSSTNIQLCKDWLLKNITSSPARIVALGKYLVSISGSLKSTSEVDTKESKPQRPSSRRRQLHILYLLNDVLHHAKYHSEPSSKESLFFGEFQPHLLDLFGYASAYDTDVYERHQNKISGLLDLWDQNGYYQSAYVAKLRDVAENAGKFGHPTSMEDPQAANGVGDGVGAEAKKDAPYMMPPSHGDSSAPFYELPAGNMLPHIMPNAPTPINPQLMKPLQFVAGPADEKLVATVEEFLRNVESTDEYNLEHHASTMDLDELGQTILRDETSGDILEGQGYYGWSRSFCEKMKRRGEGFSGMSSTYRQDVKVDSSSSPRKRRRYSGSGSSRSRGRSRSSSIRSRMGRRSRPPSSSRSRSVSREPKQYRSLRSRSRSVSRSSSYSPPPILPAPQNHEQTKDPRLLAKDRANAQNTSLTPPAFPYPFSQGIPVGPGGFPIPPPRPANYTGQWPPPPPPMPNLDNGIHSQLVPPPPPPKGPRMYQNHGPLQFPPSQHGLMPNNNGPWGQQQPPQPSPAYGFPPTGQGRGHPHLNGNLQAARGRTLGRGGWV